MISRGGNIHITWLLCFTTEIDTTTEYDAVKWELLSLSKVRVAT